MSNENREFRETLSPVQCPRAERPFLDKLRSGLGWAAIGISVSGMTLGLLGMGWPSGHTISPELFNIGDALIKVSAIPAIIYLGISYGMPTLMRFTQGHLHNHP